MFGIFKRVDRIEQRLRAAEIDMTRLKYEKSMPVKETAEKSDNVPSYNGFLVPRGKYKAKILEVSMKRANKIEHGCIISFRLRVYYEGEEYTVYTYISGNNPPAWQAIWYLANLMRQQGKELPISLRHRQHGEHIYASVDILWKELYAEKGIEVPDLG
jgi:hypothetical protein